MSHNTKRSLGALERLAIGLALLALADRIVKLGLVAHFFSRQRPDAPAAWPSVTILQTVTRGVDALRAHLEARAWLDYPAHVRHILVCDAADTDSRAVCAEMATAHPELDLRIICVGRDGMGPASKLAKLQAGLPYATGDVLCLMDDDVSPPADALCRLVTYLMQPGVGASFGLACYTNWRNLWSSLLSTYVNLYDIEFFVTWTSLCGPVRVVGQMACYWRRPFVAAGGFDELEDYLDDDFVLARRLQQAGLRPIQAPVVYDVNDPVESWRIYLVKFKRWIILPRHGMEPFLTPWQRSAAFLATPATILLPSALGAVALVTRRRIPIIALAATLGAFALAHAILCRRFLQHPMPRRGWPLLLYTVLVTPIHATLTVLAGHEIEWRGQRMRLYRDGRFERIA
jgi:ceramide glucosyltransferase